VLIHQVSIFAINYQIYAVNCTLQCKVHFMQLIAHYSAKVHFIQ